MSECGTNLELSRRVFLQAGSAAVAGAAIGCNSNPTPEAPRTAAAPAEGAATAPPAAQILGTPAGTVVSVSKNVRKLEVPTELSSPVPEEEPDNSSRSLRK